jgi:hypothetical protein
MAITVKHTKVSTVPDTTDTDLVRPSDWNADHTLTGLGSMAEQNANNVNITGGSISGATVSGYIPTSEKAQPLGVATLDAGGKVPTSQIPLQGDLNYQGTWNASTNTPTLTSSTGTQGYYYVVNVAGSTNLNGITDWQIGDWAIFNGSVWQKVDNTDAVTSVNGLVGTVVLTTTNIAEGTNEYFTTARARASVSAGTGISYDSGTGVITNSSPSLGGTVTSVGLTSSAASLAITNSPVTTSGNIGVNFSGVASQYVRGDGSLANFPTTTGGGSSVSYYLNGSVNQGTFGGNTYYEMSKTPIFGAGTNFTASSDGYIAQFITDAGDPALLSIPAGNWNFELFFSASSGGGSPSFYLELYKYDGTTFTLIASDSGSPEGITNGTVKDLYFSAIAVPATTLAVTDRLAIRVYVTTSGRTITLHTEDNNLCQVITTFSTGLNALNGLTAQVQYLATGSSGTDFNISSLTDTHTFNIPSSSATNRGLLTSTDWTTFNNKGTVSSVAATAGTGISVSGSPITSSGTLTITNTAPDQTVVLNAGSGISTSGTYPNFTITNTAPSLGGTVTSVGGTGTVNGITLTGTVTSSGNLTLGGTLSGVNLGTQVTGTLPIANGGTGATSRQDAMDALAGAVTSGQYLRGNGTDVVMSAIQAADVPTLNQNTTGTASNVTGTVAIANGGTGQTTATAAFNALNPMTTTGDLLYEASATVAARLPIGSTGQVLTVSGGIPAWAAAPSSNITTQGLYENSATISANYTIGTGNNAMSAGPITINSGVTVTVPTGSTWTVV